MTKSKLYWIRGEKSVVNSFLLGASDVCGITEQRIFERRQKMTSIADTLRSLINEMLLECKKKGDIESQRVLYLKMGFLNARERSYDGANTSFRLKNQIDLELYKRQGIHIVTVIAVADPAGYLCEACKKLDGLKIDIDEALNKVPIPPPDCDCKPCSCSF